MIDFICVGFLRNSCFYNIFVKQLKVSCFYFLDYFGGERLEFNLE